MAKILLIPVLILLSLSSDAQKKDYSDDVSSIDMIITALYDVISGEKGQARDWDRFHHLFYDGAKLIPTRKPPGETPTLLYMTSGDYVEGSGRWLVDNGFFESEISRKEEVFGNIAHVFSTYESRRSASDEQPFMRGINSIQLFNDGNRWWITNIFWVGESDDNPIPAKYLPKG